MHYTCTVCGETKEENISPKGHQYEKTVIDPTCTASGYDEYVCTVCGYSITITSLRLWAMARRRSRMPKGPPVQKTATPATRFAPSAERL